MNIKKTLNLSTASKVNKAKVKLDKKTKETYNNVVKDKVSINKYDDEEDLGKTLKTAAKIGGALIVGGAIAGVLANSSFAAGVALGGAAIVGLGAYVGWKFVKEFWNSF